MKICPIGKYLFVKVSQAKTLGGIVVPDQHQTEEEVVEILGIGPDVTQFSKGQRILAVPGCGIPTPMKDHVLVREQDVVAIVKE